jgi:hypothetical protein
MEQAKAYATTLTKNPAQLSGMPSLNTGEFKRTTYMIPQIGMVQGIKADIDRLQAPKIYTSGTKIFIVWQGGIRVADMKAATPDQLRQIKEELVSRKKETAVESFLQEARKNRKITIDKEKINS